MTGSPAFDASTSSPILRAARSPAPAPVRVLVVGGAGIDVIATPHHRLQPHTSNPGKIRFSAGGAGRNVAVNLARLGVGVRLISAVGTDPWSEQVLAETTAAGVDTTSVFRRPGGGNWYAALCHGGELQCAVSDMGAVETLGPDELQTQAHLWADARAVVIDANLLPAAIARAVALAEGRVICLLPVSPAKALRMREVAAKADLLVLSGPEAAVLTGMDIRSAADARQAIQALRGAGRAAVVLTLGPQGIGWVGESEAWLAPPSVLVVDPTGAGDAVAATAVYCLLTGVPPRDAVRFAQAAATLTVQIEGATHPELSVEVLRAHAHLA